MSTPQNSMLTRMAVSSVDFAVRYWPESSRRWGQALLAEMGEISEPGAALSWAAGGIVLFFRALLSHFFDWMRLPAGRGFSRAPISSDGKGPQFPKHSRLATGVILLGAVALLLLPVGREARNTVAASWRGFHPSAGDRRDLEKIAEKAEKEKDARGLAFVALTYPNPNRAIQFADRAVALDSSLAWIYVSRYYGGDIEDSSRSTERSKLVQKSDPDNAFVYLMSAFAEGEPRLRKAIAKAAWTPEAPGETLGSDKEWMKEMETAFGAPKYDGYYRRHEELVREGWKRNPSLSPGLVAIGLWVRSIPDALQVQTYADLRVEQALQTGSAGKVDDAKAMLSEVTELGTRMLGADPTPFVQIVGLGLTKRGLEGFKKLYRAEGRTHEATETEVQLKEVEASSDGRVHSYMGWRSDVMSAVRRKALVVQLSAFLSILFAVTVVLSLLALEAGTAFRWKGSGMGRRIACGVANYGPALFLMSSVVFLWSFRPFAAIFAQYRTGELSNLESIGLFWELFTIGNANLLKYFYEPYHQWLIVTVALAAIAVVVIVRGLMRGKTIAPAR